MYVNIAICDDEIAICNQIEQYIIETFTAKEIDFSTDIFTSGNSLCKAMKTETYDLVFLDIELPGINGIQTGTFIRDNLHNNTIQIVYISAVQSYAIQLFQSRPMNFLVKPLDSHSVKEVLLTFLRLFGDTDTFFTFKVNGHFHKLALSDILYFESHKRKVTVVTRESSYDFYGSLKKICEQISSTFFIMIHQSLLINFNHVIFFEYDRITMSNNEVLPVSQSRRSEVRNKYLTLMTGDSND